MEIEIKDLVRDATGGHVHYTYGSNRQFVATIDEDLLSTLKINTRYKIELTELVNRVSRHHVFEQSVREVLNIEGGYTNDSSDSGGETNRGITIGVARDFGYTGEMINLPEEVALHVYYTKYWLVNNLSNVATLSEKIAEEAFECGVNCGTSTAAKILQRSLNLFNAREKHYADIKVDGHIGNNTIKSIEEYFKYRPGNSKILVKAMNILQGYYYISLAERREKDEKYIYGWLANRVVL